MKRAGFFSLVILLCLFTGCGKVPEEGETSIKVDRKGGITASVREAFDKDYYDKGELKETIQNAIADYNKQADGEPIKLEKFRVGGKVAKVTMSYASDEDYKNFNQTDIMNGELEEVLTAGYNIQTMVTDRHGKQVLLHNLVAAKEPYHIAVFTEDCTVETSERILYVSGNVTTEGRRIAHVDVNDTAEYAFVVYQ